MDLGRKIEKKQLEKHHHHLVFGGDWNPVCGVCFASQLVPLSPFTNLVKPQGSHLPQPPVQ